MTHEYVIALGGRIRVSAHEVPGEAPASAIAWAADRVLAVGSDDAVTSISRGDSIFLDLGGSVVTTSPADGADELEPGSLADLDFWDADPSDPAGRPIIVASVRAGAFTQGDEHCGPFRRVRAPLPGEGSFDPEIRDDPE
jgi:predicted amidohydrolase YtcJ